MLTFSGAVRADSRKFDIPAGDLKTALDAYIRQSGTQLIYKVDDVRGKQTHGVQGVFESDDALNQLLSESGFRAVHDVQGAIVITPVRSASPRVLEQGNAESTLQEIIVTASKIRLPAREVAGSITQVTGAQLAEVGAQGFSDYLTRVPGVVFNATIPGLSTATIRGISTTTSLDQGQGTTGYFLNDVPLTEPNFALGISDIDAFDVNNVVVLRGPQGTLFGSASLGGAINFEAERPNLQQFQIHVQTTAATGSEGAGSASGKLMVNVPLISDRLAVRGVFVYRNDGGYISNIGTGARNSNNTTIEGGRVEVAWNPTESTHLSYLFLKQQEDTKDNGYQEPILAGPLEKKTRIPEPEDFTTVINNLRLDQDLRFATLTATATTHRKTQYSDSDLTAIFGPLFGNQLSPISAPQHAYSSGTTFELRLASPTGRRFEYVIGAFHDTTHEYFLDLFGAPGAEKYATANYDPFFGAGFGARAAPNDIFYNATLSAVGYESALFGEGTFHFTDEWKITLGGREFQEKVVGATSSAGLLEYLLTSPNVLSFRYSSDQKAHGFTPKASVTWTPSKDIMAYALASKGFRFGGPNINPPDPKNPFPPTYGPDNLWNYEVGTRTNWFDQRLQMDATVFYVNWSDIQVRLGTASGLAYATNLGKAKSYGFETTESWHPTSALTLNTNLTYTDAHLVDGFTSGSTTALPGATLPAAAKWNASASVRYDWSGIPLRPSVVISDRIISSAPGNFGQVVPVTLFNYNLLDARLALHLKTLEATLFVSNATDKRGVSSASYFPGSPFEQYLVRPRTFGITLDYRL
jgi:iron complex outermembrane receptor protein